MTTNALPTNVSDRISHRLYLALPCIHLCRSALALRQRLLIFRCKPTERRIAQLKPTPQKSGKRDIRETAKLSPVGDLVGRAEINEKPGTLIGRDSAHHPHPTIVRSSRALGYTDKCA